MTDQDLADMQPDGAEFSACRKYRYRLWRRWDSAKPRLGYLMLNPSTACERRDDATVRQCVERAKRHGYGGLEVANLYAYCSTKPGLLWATTDPIGPDNDAHLLLFARRVAAIICAWGAHAEVARVSHVGRLLALLNDPPALYHLGLTKDGAPRHPLRVPYARPMANYAPC